MNVNDASVLEMINNLIASERLNKKLYTMMARNCGKPDDYFLKLIHDKGHADWFLEAEEAKDHNIVQQLRIPQLTGKVLVNIELE